VGLDWCMKKADSSPFHKGVGKGGGTKSI